jgi:putative transposase
MLYKAHMIQLNPTKAQKVLLHKSFGCARHSFNWAFDKWKEMYQNGEKPSAMTLIKLQNSIKKEQMPFYLEVNKCAVQYAIWDLEKAYSNFFKGIKKFPKYKSKKIKESFVALENGNNFKQVNKKIRLPRIGWVKCSEDLRFEGKVNYVVVKRVSDKYFAIVNVLSNEIPKINESQVVVGIDLGIKNLFVCSDGKIFNNPNSLKKEQKALSRIQRWLSRKVKGSSNYQKNLTKYRRKNYKITCIRKTFIHQVTNYLVNNYGKIVIEDLNVQGIVRNKNLCKSLLNASFGEISRQLAYKSSWNGVELVKANRFYASSKICSSCGTKKQVLKLSERVFNCSNCNLSIDRDLNAAKNLAKYSPTHESGESNACGEVNSVSEMECWTSVNHEIDLNGNFSNFATKNLNL